MSRLFFQVLICAFLLSNWSCSDDTELGYDVLIDEELELITRDDFALPVRQLGPQPIDIPYFVTNNISLRLIPSRHSIGTLDDPRFGKFSSSFYVRPIPGFVPPPEPEGTIFDSALLLLKIDTATIYGNDRAFFDLKVFDVTEPLTDIDSSSTDRTYSFDPVAVGERLRLIPTELDTVRLPNITTVDTTEFTDVVSIKLNSRYANRLYSENQNLTDVLNGFYVEALSGNTIMQMDLADEASALVFFYKDTLDVSRVYPFSYDLFRPLVFDYDISGSQLEQALNDPVDNDFLYVQGHAGSAIEVDISDLKSVEDPFVNFASIEFFVDISQLANLDMFPLTPALDLYKINDSGNLEEIFDLSYGQLIGQVGGVFDGQLEEVEEGIYRYELNITTHVKEFLKDSETPLLYLTVRDRVDTPNNVIIYGPNHPMYRAKLKLTYTKT